MEKKGKLKKQHCKVVNFIFTILQWNDCKTKQRWLWFYNLCVCGGLVDDCGSEVLGLNNIHKKVGRYLWFLREKRHTCSSALEKINTIWRSLLGQRKGKKMTV